MNIFEWFLDTLKKELLPYTAKKVEKLETWRVDSSTVHQQISNEEYWNRKYDRN